MKRRKHSSKGRARAGFTLLELMVALVAGVAAITSIYFVSSASARHFHEQQRVAQTQMSLRMAVEQMRRDLQRAGYLGTPNSDVEQTCVNPSETVVAVEHLDDNDTTRLPQSDTNGVTADRLRLAGNFVTSDSYLAIGLANTAGTALTLQRDWQAFRRDFGIFGGASYDADAFADVFRAGRMLHITTQQGKHFFVTVQGANASTATISFTPGIGVGGHCVVGLADGATVAPLSRVEYLVMRDEDFAGTEVAQLAPAGAAATDPDEDFQGKFNTYLVRREISFADASAIAGSERFVLEYAANVDYRFVVDTATNPTDPPALATVAGITGGTDPQDVRSIVVSLSARTADQDPRFPWTASAAGDPASFLPPTRYRVVDPSASYEGASRVRSVRQEIMLPNLANRNLR